MVLTLEILRYIVLVLSIGLSVYAFVFLFRERKKLKLKENERFQDHSVITNLNSTINEGTFDFEVLQNRADLLKKNSGHNLCDLHEEIVYVEYCDSVCNFNHKKGEES